MGVKVGFGKALRTLSDLADAILASGAMTEMSGTEFVAYAAGQLALASTEPKNEAASRIAALKAAIATATEQVRSAEPGAEAVVFVKVYDCDTASYAHVESAIAECKTAVATLRMPGLASHLDNEVAPTLVVARRAPTAAAAATRRKPARSGFYDDDPDADDWNDEFGEGQAQTDGSESEDNYGSDLVDDDADSDDLDAYMKTLGPNLQVSKPSNAGSGRTREKRAPAQVATTRKSPAPAVTTARQRSKPPPPRKTAMPRPMSPADLAAAVRAGHGTSPRLTTTRNRGR